MFRCILQLLAKKTTERTDGFGRKVSPRRLYGFCFYENTNKTVYLCKCQKFSPRSKMYSDYLKSMLLATRDETDRGGRKLLYNRLLKK